ncbi:MAG: sensor histidine kinase [Acidimicrobiales bacterium]
MKLATRLTILLIIITVVVSLGVGWFAVKTSTDAAYQTLDSSINAVAQTGKGNPNSALSSVYNAVQGGAYDFTLDVVYPSGPNTRINEGLIAPKSEPTLANVHDSLSGVVEVANLPGFRIRSLNIGGGDYLVIEASTKSIVDAAHRLILRVLLAALIAALAMVIIARLFMRRDLVTMEDLIDYASDVAHGASYEDIPASRGSRDVRELQGALATMVASLREKIEIEARHAETMQAFIGDASHELRTPLTVIKGYTELMSGQDLGPEQRARSLERMGREITRMEALVSDLLLLAEIREVPQNVRDKVNLSDIVCASVRDFKDDAPLREVGASVEPGVLIEGRRDFAERIVLNALGNIARHTPETAAVQVSLSRQGRESVLIIEDGGSGLPHYGLRPQRFMRFDPSRARTSGGSGLGMSIMADLSEVLGGSMMTSQSPLGGLRLTFRLPSAP